MPPCLGHTPDWLLSAGIHGDTQVRRPSGRFFSELVSPFQNVATAVSGFTVKDGLATADNTLGALSYLEIEPRQFNEP